MAEKLQIRAVTLSDVPGLVRLHSGSEGPWAEAATCALWVNHRLLRPFICHAATLDGEVVGHAEWIVSDEPAPVDFQLYLGMIEIHPGMRGRGIGSAMVHHGREHAQRLECRWLRTVPDDDVTGFYDRCGLKPEREIQAYRIAVRPNELPANWRPVRRVPKRVIGSLPMRLGSAQACSAHMWETCNRPVVVAGESERHPCVARHDGQAYVQLRHAGQGDDAFVLSWAAASVPGDEVMAAAHAIGSRIALAELLLMGYADEMPEFGDLGACESTTWVWSVETS